jgi:hypothetical protein
MRRYFVDVLTQWFPYTLPVWKWVRRQGAWGAGLYGRWECRCDAEFVRSMWR